MWNDIKKHLPDFESARIPWHEINAVKEQAFAPSEKVE